MDNDRVIELIEMLTASEGASVEILCQDPEGLPGQRVITVSDSWTDWQPKRFAGLGLLEALQLALSERQAAGNQYKLEGLYAHLAQAKPLSGLEAARNALAAELRRVEAAVNRCGGSCLDDTVTFIEQIGQIRATLLLNFSEQHSGVYGFVVKDEGTAHQMMVTVLEHLVKPYAEKAAKRQAIKERTIEDRDDPDIHGH